MKKIIEEIGKLSAGSEAFALATIIKRNGSAPRSTGAKMLVKKDSGIIGTIGGGILEAQVQHLAVKMIEERRAAIQSYQFSGNDAATMDAICGGEVEVLVEYMDPGNPQTLEIFHHLQAAHGQHRKTWWLTVLPNETASTTHVLVQSDGRIYGDLPVGLAVEEVIATRLPIRLELDQQEVMIEPLDVAGTAYIFGAGHVSRSLAEFVRAVGFWTVVLDNRAEYANRERFPEVDGLIVLDSFQDVLGKIHIDRESFIVIVTRGHLDDLTVLAQVLKYNAAYIGMIGSQRKSALIFEQLRKTGYHEEDIQRVHAPIGIPISAETPEEIGISIVAEMIQARAKFLRQSVE